MRHRKQTPSTLLALWPPKSPHCPSPGVPPRNLTPWWGFGSQCDNPTAHMQMPKSWPCCLCLAHWKGSTSQHTLPRTEHLQPAKPELLVSSSQFRLLGHWSPAFSSGQPCVHGAVRVANRRHRLACGARLSARPPHAFQPARPASASPHKIQK